MAAVLAASTPSPALESSVPWFERITVTVDDQGHGRFRPWPVGPDRIQAGTAVHAEQDDDAHLPDPLDELEDEQ